jgi:subfamily B ATP-binding cassette protein MsbA
MRIIRSLEIPGVLIEFMGSIGIALVLLYVALVDQKSPGGFFQFVLSIIALYQPIKELSRLPGQLQQARASSQRVFELLDTQTTIEEPRQPLLFRADKTDIQFDGIDFAYGDKPALRNIHLTVRAGQLVALVGSSGSGKTTLANLLLRFYDPQRGAVRINGTDIRQFGDARSAQPHRRGHAGSHSVQRHHPSKHRSRPAGEPPMRRLKKPPDMPMRTSSSSRSRGVTTRSIGEKGVNLSGGQRQRIAIARAILKQAPILILDEATSALDTESERAVQAALEELMQGRSTLCIAHRLSTIQSADLIVVMDQGRIVETGKHA